MSANTKIEWTDRTWNPLVGCTRVSPGCQHCYAETMSFRQTEFAKAELAQGKTLGRRKHYLNVINDQRHWNHRIAEVEEAMAEPLKLRTSKKIFVNSMSDLFHKEVSLDFILRVFNVMRQAHWHTFQVLTKRSERLLELDPQLPWTPNVWMGVSVENADYLHRIDDLRATHAAVKFLSLEPLLGPLNGMNLRGIGWAIVGGESGPGSRPMEKSWVTDIRDQCLANRVPFFFKQWGGVNKKAAGRELDGRTWDEFPGHSPEANEVAAAK